ncbi:arsinothricin resistance N-acetyltransferase ArsN1 family A [Bacillus sp. AK128]
MLVREATINDLPTILKIYNQGIEDRIATLETELKDDQYMLNWFLQHGERYKVMVAEIDGHIAGWASLNPYNMREAYRGVADLSVYISRESRAKGVGTQLLDEIEKQACEQNFHKMILFTFPYNRLGQGLYRKRGFREVGVFRNQGILDGEYVDVMAMEKLLK